MKIPKIVKDELDRCGLEWEAVDGGCHTKLFLAGRLVGILPKNAVKDASGRSALNTRSNIRRRVREVRA